MLLCFGASDPDSAAAHGDDGFRRQVVGVPGQQVVEQANPLGRRHVGEPIHSAVGSSTQKDQLAKIGVDRDQYPSLGSCPLKNDRISRVFPAFPGLGDVMAAFAKPDGDPMAGAAIEETSLRDDTDGVE